MTDYIKGILEGYKRALSCIDIIDPEGYSYQLNILKQLLEAKMKLYLDEKNEAKLINGNKN